VRNFGTDHVLLGSDYPHDMAIPSPSARCAPLESMMNKYRRLPVTMLVNFCESASEQPKIYSEDPCALSPSPARTNNA
jgi:hypothetical protein